ncbi:bone marrow stromal antigen 2 [Tupaia chinensis]|uniref:bone marrow stromal antigen 2 n=1 Tax=Tupaia chinensis TaxID=246437 RepID=UPI0003C8E2B5|nr:bone marrow stromal antigen 2 [Tupaia chinensis]
MAPTFYHYLPVPMGDLKDQESALGGRRLLIVVILGLLLVVGLVVALAVFAARANSEACLDGLRAEVECHNVTHLLQRQLTQAQDGVLKAETQAATCNQTLVSLMAAEKEEKDRNQKREQQLQGEIATLNDKLQQTLADLDRLRRELSRSRNSAPSSVGSLLILFLGLYALLL